MNGSTTSSPSVRRRTRLGALTALLGALTMALAQSATAAPADALAWTHGCKDANLSARIAPIEAMRTAVACLVNRERRTHHLPPLRQSRALDRSAQRWTRTMVRADVFSHGANFATRITQAGVRWSDAGENIATGFATPRDVVDAWMSSTDHCRNILDPNFRLVGVGADPHPVRGSASGPATWTEDFALQRGARPPSQDWAPADGCPYG
ncbi:MAG: CAP domain-containing protein [Solirubrobacteraceae bacterium]